MANLVLPNLSDEIICKIIAIFGEESFWNLGPFMRAGKRSYSLVQEPSVLKRCNVSPMVCEEYNCEIGLYGKFRKFFMMCVNVGNINAVFYEGLHLAVKCGLEEAIQVLEANVPTHELSTLALGVFNVCLGRDTVASKAFHQFAVKHADLRSEILIDLGDQFEWRLSWFLPPYLNTYGQTFKFPEDLLVKAPKCIYAHDYTGESSGSCKNCRLFWICCNVSHML